MARFKNLPREIRPGTCTMFRAMEKVRVHCVSLPQLHLGRWAAWNGTSPIPASKVLLLLLLNSCLEPQATLQLLLSGKTKQKPPLSSLCFSSKHCGGQSACRSTCSESPAVTLWLLPEELRLPSQAVVLVMSAPVARVVHGSLPASGGLGLSWTLAA